MVREGDRGWTYKVNWSSRERVYDTPWFSRFLFITIVHVLCFLGTSTLMETVEEAERSKVDFHTPFSTKITFSSLKKPVDARKSGAPKNHRRGLLSVNHQEFGLLTQPSYLSNSMRISFLSRYQKL